MKLNYRNSLNARAISTIYGKSLDKPDWYEIKNLNTDTPEIIITDYIGWPYNDPADLIRTLGEIGDKPILVRISSPGGDCFDGLHIFNALQSHKGKVTIRIEALAASIASVIALAGKDRQAYKNAMIMIHEPYLYTVGNQFELLEDVDILSKLSNNFVEEYADNTKVGKKELRTMLRAETWLTAKEALEKGFIDSIVDGKGAKANFDLSIYANVPDGISGESGNKELTIRDIEKFLRDGGVSNKKAKAVLAGWKNVYGENDNDEAGQGGATNYTVDLEKLMMKFKGV